MTTRSRKLSVPADDIGTMLICSLRYAIGRQTYIPGVVSEMVHRYWSHVSPNDRSTLARDLASKIKDCDEGRFSAVLGADCDAKVWRELAAWMVEHEVAA